MKKTLLDHAIMIPLMQFPHASFTPGFKSYVFNDLGYPEFDGTLAELTVRFFNTIEHNEVDALTHKASLLQDQVDYQIAHKAKLPLVLSAPRAMSSIIEITGSIVKYVNRVDRMDSSTAVYRNNKALLFLANVAEEVMTHFHEIISGKDVQIERMKDMITTKNFEKSLVEQEKLAVTKIYATLAHTDHIVKYFTEIVTDTFNTMRLEKSTEILTLMAQLYTMGYPINTVSEAVWSYMIHSKQKNRLIRNLNRALTSLSLLDSKSSAKRKLAAEDALTQKMKEGDREGSQLMKDFVTLLKLLHFAKDAPLVQKYLDEYHRDMDATPIQLDPLRYQSAYSCFLRDFCATDGVEFLRSDIQELVKSRLATSPK